MIKLAFQTQYSTQTISTTKGPPIIWRLGLMHKQHQHQPTNQPSPKRPVKPSVPEAAAETSPHGARHGARRAARHGAGGGIQKATGGGRALCPGGEPPYLDGRNLFSDVLL